MPIIPLAAGTRIGPESEPNQFRIARARRLGDVVIEYHAQDVERGDACVILEFAPSAICVRGAEGRIVPDADAGSVWRLGLDEFLDRSTAERLDAIRHVEELRAVFPCGGSGYWALKTAPNSPVIPYESDVVPGAPRRRRSASVSRSRQIEPVAYPSPQSQSQSQRVRPVVAVPPAAQPQSQSQRVRPVVVVPPAAQSRSQRVRPVAGSEVSHSQRIRPAGAGPSVSRSRPMSAVSGPASAAHSRPVQADSRDPAVSHSQRVRPVADGSTASRTGRIRPASEGAGSPARGPSPRPLAPSNSPAMDALQAELMALVEGSESGVQVADEARIPRRDAESKSTISLLEAFGITEENKFRLAIFSKIAFALILLLQFCGQG